VLREGAPIFRPKKEGEKKGWRKKGNRGWKVRVERTEKAVQDSSLLGREVAGNYGSSLRKWGKEI